MHSVFNDAFNYLKTVNLLSTLICMLINFSVLPSFCLLNIPIHTYIYIYNILCVFVCVRERMGSSSNSSLIEQAKEELEILEFQHPNGFKCLKMELRAFISDLESQNMVQDDATFFISSCADTQESSNREKRKKIGSHGSIKRSNCKTEAVLERAQQCLHKIQHFKTHFYI